MISLDVLAFFVKHLQENMPDDEPNGGEWAVENMATYTYDECIDEILDGCPQYVKKYVDTVAMLKDLWFANERLFIVYHDNDKICMLENIDELYPIWEKKEVEFLVGHPFRDINFTIIRYMN